MWQSTLTAELFPQTFVQQICVYLLGPVLEDTRDMTIDITNLNPYALEFAGKAHPRLTVCVLSLSTPSLLKH